MSTTASESVDIFARMDIDTVAPKFTRALASLDAATTKQLDEAGIETALRELVRIRASQLNGCAYSAHRRCPDGWRTSRSDHYGARLARVAALHSARALGARPHRQHDPHRTDPRERHRLGRSDSSSQTPKNWEHSSRSSPRSTPGTRSVSPHARGHPRSDHPIA